MMENFVYHTRRMYWKWRLGSLGDGARIFPGVNIENPAHIFIGKRTMVYHQTFLAVGEGSITVGDDVTFGIRVYCNVTKGDLLIGDESAIGANAQIYTYSIKTAAGARHYDNHFHGNVRIGNNVIIGAGAIILPGVSIGDNSVVGAASVVAEDVPENVMICGNPARIFSNLALITGAPTK